MRILSNKYIKRLFATIVALMLILISMSQLVLKIEYGRFSITLFVLMPVILSGIILACNIYFKRQDRMIENAVIQIEDFVAGNTDSRIDCYEEGEINRLFHSINNLSSVLSAKATNENHEKEFLKNTISDISHQLKTPLAALNIYNGILQEQAEGNEEIQEFVKLSENEIDRIETLVQNLLKITKLDSGTMTFNKSSEDVGDMMRDIELHFSYRAKSEGKEIILTGEDDVTLNCDRDWLIEAVENLVKNALDHTQEGNRIEISWKKFNSLVQINVKDNGSGIHPEDIYHIFKRFYRSRFSQDSKGIGLGLPLTKAIVEAHDGTIEIDSELGKGSTFIMNFLNNV